MFDYEAAKFWLEVIIFLVNAALWIYVWRSNKDKATNTKIEEMVAKFDHEIKDVRNDAVRMEERQKHAVCQKDLGPLYERITAVEKELKAEIAGVNTELAKLSGRFDSVDRLAAAIEQIGIERSMR